MSIHALRLHRALGNVNTTSAAETRTDESASASSLSRLHERSSFVSGGSWDARPPGDLPTQPGSVGSGMRALFLSVPDFYSADSVGIGSNGSTIEAAPGKLRSSHKSGIDGKMFTGSMGLQDSYDCFGYELGLDDTDFDVLMAIARNEGNIDALNTYDSAILSFGFMQWTAKYELADLLHEMKELDPQEFQKFFGRHGLDVVKDGRDWELSLDGKVLDKTSEKWDAFFGKPARRSTIQEWEDIFYTSRNAESMHKAQLLLGKKRIDKVRDLPAGNGASIGDYVKSSYGLTHVVDYHVNRPAYAKEAFQEAIRALGNPAPGEVSEEEVIAAFTGRRIERNDGTHAADRVASIDAKFGLNSAISDGHYIVRPGDGLYKIARQLGTTPDALRQANPGMSSSLRVGQKLRLPGTTAAPSLNGGSSDGTHRVADGETLWSIAHSHGVDVEQLYALNPSLDRSSTIHVGQELRVRPPQNPSGGSGTHVVASGDTPWNISQRYGVDVDALLAHNGLSRGEVLSLGQELSIPGLGGSSSSSDSTHVVAAGDTLYSLSSHYGVDLDALLQANGLHRDSVLSIGQELQLPQGESKALFHTVGSGDTLYSIAQHYGISVNDLRRNNPELGSSNVIRRGQQLHIKGSQSNGSKVSHASPTTSINADTSAMTEAQRYDHYAALIGESGGELRAGTHHRNLVSLRTVTDADARGGNGRYDDVTAMLWIDASGHKRVREYRSNTEPSARYRGTYGVDANGDGRLDQGRMMEGYYEFKTEYHSKLGHVLRPTRSQNAERDTNQDGLFNDGATASAGRSMLFHRGGRNATYSAGCQTMPPDVYKKFWSDLNANGNPGTVGYTLIER